MENRFMTHQDYKDWITETAILTRLSLPHITKALTEAAHFTEMRTQSGVVVTIYENGLNFSRYFLMEGVQM